MKIVYVYADTPQEWNSSEWRCAVPARAINRTGRHRADLLSIDDFRRQSSDAKALCQASDVIVIQRNLFGEVLPLIQYWKARDKAIIVDFDDAYNLIEPTNLNYSFWVEGFQRETGQKIDPSPLTQFKWGLRMVQAATVPSKRLADDWQYFTDVFYLPNFIDLNLYQNIKAQVHPGIIIGWGGSVSHLQSFQNSGVLEALGNVCASRQEVTVMVCGSDRRIFEALPVAEQQKIFTPWVSYQDWPSILSNFDIGLAPLAGEYDERRSWIKVLEYMVMKIPWIASEGPPYQEFRNCGWLVNNTAQSWERVLTDVIDHLKEYKAEVASIAYLSGISRAIDENVHQIMSIYTSIYEQSAGSKMLS